MKGALKGDYGKPPKKTSGSSGVHRKTRVASDPAPAVPFDTTLPDSRQLLRIVLTAGGDMLESAHAFLSSYLQRRFPSQLAARMSVAVYELTSNALSYGSMNQDVLVELWIRPDSVAIRTSNQTSAARVAMLSDHLAKLRTQGEGALEEQMRRSVAGGPRLMLGLSRVMHEVGLKLDVDVEGTRVTVTASSRV
jgi:anti-sigma regulatory factor (Ser/Thr protein kinase)